MGMVFDLGRDILYRMRARRHDGGVRSSRTIDRRSYARSDGVVCYDDGNVRGVYLLYTSMCRL